MHRKIFITLFILVVPLLVHSDNLRHVDVVTTLEIEIVDTTYPKVTWAGSGPMRYRWTKGEGELMGGDVPRMTQHCPVQVPGYNALLLAISGQQGSVATLKFEEHVVVTGLNLDVTIQEPVVVAGVAVPNSGRDLVTLHFQNIQLTSGVVMVQGHKLTGTIDTDKMEVDTVFATKVPSTGNSDLDKEIAGKTVVGHFKVGLKNPYQK